MIIRRVIGHGIGAHSSSASSLTTPLVYVPCACMSSSSLALSSTRPNTVYLRDDRHEIYLVGTAHVSNASAREVKEV
jgi:hypothetical protein